MRGRRRSPDLEHRAQRSGGRRSMGARDLVDEVIAGIAARPARTVLTTLGTVLGVASLVATLGLAQTASGQVAEQFDAVVATQITVSAREPDPASSGANARAEIPWDAAARVRALTGVEVAGTYGAVDVDDDVTRTVSVTDPRGVAAHTLPVLAGSSGLLEAVRGTIVTGRFFDDGHDRRADPVVVLGANAAERLNIGRVARQPTIFIGDRAFVVIGIIDGVTRRGDLLDALILPNGTARYLYGLTSPEQVHVRTVLGAADLVGRQAPIALDPTQPEAFEAAVPPSPSGVRDRVQAEVNAVLLLLAGLALLVGGFGIANVTLLTVIERTGEIGLRRALGAERRHIAAQFLLESFGMGLLGGLIGASIGVAVTVGTSVARDWTPLLDLPLAGVAPLLGAGVGLLAGAYPAWKATTIEPIGALRKAA